MQVLETMRFDCFSLCDQEQVHMKDTGNETNWMEPATSAVDIAAKVAA
ncbi:MAG: hypothetical protein JOY65_14700 [Acetobacteraceae bacterium]|nr:hypothetical protein [Acetobacteraceae bacterium]